MINNKEKSKPLVIYHGNCSDGFGAAWVVRKIYPNAEFHPAFFGAGLPDVENRDVLILDFSYKREILLDLKNKAKSLLLIDHHITAAEELKGLNFCVFDMNHSGAGLTWKYFKDELNEETPWLISYIEDQDLQRFKLPFSREINATINSFGFDFKALDNLVETYPNESIQNSLMVYEGRTILRQQDRLVETMAEHAVETNFVGYRVPVANASCLFSDVAKRLSRDRPFGAAWFKREDGLYVYSLSSQLNGVNVGRIAKCFGGGGHDHSAGFTSNRLVFNY